MAKVMFILKNKIHIKLSRTVLRNSIYISTGFIVFILIFNILFLLLIKKQLTSILDSKISHEMDHVYDSFKIKNDSLIIVRYSEFNEKDLTEIYDNSFFIQILSKNGKILLKSKNLQNFCYIPVELNDLNSFDSFKNTTTTRELLRTGYRKIIDNDRIIGYLQISARRIFLETALSKIIYYNLIIAPFVFIIIILTSYFISKQINKPISKIITTSKKFSANSLNIRIDMGGELNDEIQQLEKTLNDLFDRLQNQVNELSSFTNNVSHQLMNPLAVILSEIEFLIEQCSQSTENINLVITLKLIKEKTIYIKSIVESLLILARSENINENKKKIFSLNNIIENKIKPFYNSNLLKIIINKEILLKGNEEYFSIVINNLIENAFKYSLQETPVIVEVEKNTKSTIIYIKDEGIGIPDDEKEEVFNRFYRGKNIENLPIKGVGLGLSLCYSIVNSMNGKIKILDNYPKGTIVKLEFPTINFS